MKSNYNSKEHRIRLDNEAIRAIRFVNYFPLNGKLKYVDRQSLWDWCDKHIIPLTNGEIITTPKWDSNDFESYERMLWRLVADICRC